MPAVDNYFIAWKGQRDGPYSLAQLEALLEKGDIGLLHRVETPNGPVPLRQILLEANPARWSNAGAASPPPPEAAPPPPNAAATSPAEVSPVVPPPAKLDDPMLVYTICGLCFLLPPLFFWTWTMGDKIAARGDEQGANRLKCMGIILACSGVIFWMTMIWAWR